LNNLLRPIVLVVSAPSGAGKTTLCSRLRAEFPAIVYSISCTTRPPRHGERDGADYYFLTPEQFEARRAAGEFLEYAQVHGAWYGTPRGPVVAALRQGRDVLMDIDVQGATQVRAYAHRAPESDPIHHGYVDVFIAPPSLEELRQRLVRRGTDSSNAIERRLRQAETEMARAGEFQHVIVNDDLDRAYAQLREIYLQAKQPRTSH
jgi:guanylate kinase